MKLVFLFQLGLAVARVDLPGVYNFEDAQNACYARGLDLPTIEEAGEMWCHSDFAKYYKTNSFFPQSDMGCTRAGISRSIRNLQKDIYWSRSVYSPPTTTRPSINFVQYFVMGRQGKYYTTPANKLRVRCVRRFR